MIPVLNPVYIEKVESYSLDMLDGFIAHNEKRLEQFKIILEEMKNDYQELIDCLISESPSSAGMVLGEKVKYIEKIIKKKDPKNAGKSIAALAMGIQKGKYDGTKESFEKCLKG